ncbi:MAG TPA: alpha/beta hydrolase [Kineosporiaceae bacterium]|nr:alpha/beta hydrolase [Kineosporiaceae bacterium]
MTWLAGPRRNTPTAVLAAVAVTAPLLLGGCVGGSGSGTGPSVPPAVPLPSTASATSDPANRPELAKFYGQPLNWSRCGGGFDCAKVTVPVDWAQPDGPTIQLAVKRLPAAGKKIGSMLVNPGGPGVSGLSFVDQARTQFGEHVRDSFDIVGWDPRGVGKSAPINCYSVAQVDKYVAQDATPDTPAEVDALVQAGKDLGAACQRAAGDLLGHIDTLSTVKDMDVLRAVLKDSRLSYYGASYGTFIGAWYAQEFPWRVGRLVLDGAVDPSLTTDQYTEGQAEGFYRGLRAFVADCQKKGSCPLRGSVDDGIKQLGDLIQAADQNPLRTNDKSGRKLTESLFLVGVAMAMYLDQLWPTLVRGLTEAQQGDGSTLLTLADAYYERDDPTAYTGTLGANAAIFCLDHPDPDTPAQAAQLAARLQQKYPPEGGAIGWGVLGCAQWPIKPVLTPQKLTATGAAPILVVGTTGDPATPYAWAKSLAAQLGSGRLLTWEGSGHTAYGQGSTCVVKVVESYLVAGVVPARDTTCTS